MSIPYIGFGNDTLAQQPKLSAGDTIICAKCGLTHVLEASEPPLLLTYRCRGKGYLAAVNGRSVMSVKPDCKGSI